MKNTTRTNLLRRRSWQFAVVGALLLQSLFPSGYMPANLAGGWVAMLCPEGLPAEFVQQLAGNSGHEQHLSQQHAHHQTHQQVDAAEHASHAADMSMDYCQLGSGVDQPFTEASTDTSVDIAAAEAAIVLPVQRSVYASARRSFSARAPPVS